VKDHWLISTKPHLQKATEAVVIRVAQKKTKWFFRWKRKSLEVLEYVNGALRPNQIDVIIVPNVISASLRWTITARGLPTVLASKITSTFSV
jgi:hypothetical protein